MYELILSSLHASQVGPKGKVIGIDHIKELVDDSINNVKKDDPGLITSGRVKLIGKSSVLVCPVVSSEVNVAQSTG